ncbi:hypothetical protein GGH94_003844 [Coemansia aciculifera]|uniref:CRAL-TRIO domain-containing protein n=1 Tax=Coemansia aciculifera TaxID=417176 RepID=A0A9W8IQF0_9FUNG|nr:hypothetical protein GGH94_003844 [Coemansia aciculifera]
MSAFLSGLLGRKSAITEDTAVVEKPAVVYDFIPRLEPSPNMPVEHTPEATPEEQQAIDLVNMQRAKLLTDLPAEPTDDGLLFDAPAWLTDTRILIYLRACKGDPQQAIARLRGTLEWHSTYRPHAITPASMRAEGATGKMYINGYDQGGRPLLYMFPHLENTSDATQHLRYIVFTMEQAIRSMPPGVTKLTIVIDASQFSPLARSVPLSTAREFLNVLEKHYPDRLGKALVLSPPAYFVVFYRIVAPFIDPVTKSKIAFVDVKGEKGKGRRDGDWVDVRELVDPGMLQLEAGGDWTYKYSQDQYWPVLERMYRAVTASAKV